VVEEGRGGEGRKGWWRKEEKDVPVYYGAHDVSTKTPFSV
jgi:hypothetical protein